MSNGHENFILPQKVKEVPSTLYHTSDGDVFVDKRTAETHQHLINNLEKNGWKKNHERK